MMNFIIILFVENLYAMRSRDELYKYRAQTFSHAIYLCVCTELSV